MKARIKNTRIFSRYATAYFMVLLAVSGIILVASLLYSANILLQTEQQNARNNMQLAADTLEKQFQVMENVAIQIGSTEKYRPNVLRLGPSRDIVMLEDFVKYVNYSPLSANYFLAYPSDKKKIYKADGTTTYFDYYGPAVLEIPYGQTDEVFWQILNEKTVSFVYSESCILCVCPVRFYGYGRSYHAALCFVLTKEQILEYLEQVCAGLPERCAIRAGGEWILNNMDGRHSDVESASNCMDVISPDGKILLCAPMYLRGWQLLMARNSVIFYVCIGLCALLILLIAMVMAHVSMLPLNRLIEKYMPADSKFEYNFQQLDLILGEMSRMNSDIRYQLKNHLLNLILRGEYSSGLLERWSITGIVFERSLYCVYLVTGGEEAGRLLGQELEKLKGLDVDFYIAEMEHIDMTAVIVGYDSNVTHKQVTEMIRLAASGCSLESYAGRPVDSPKRLPLSMISAQTAGSKQGSSSRNDVQSDFLAERMIAAAVSGSQEAMEEVVRDVEAFLSNASSEGLLRKKNLYEFLQNVLSKAGSQGVEVDRSEVNSLVLLSDISMILNDLQKLLLESAGTSAQNQITGKDAAKILVEYVIANAYDPDINLQGMSDRFGLSNDYISSMIKRETGFAFKEYLTMLRIAEGKRLLTEDKSLTVNDVAVKVGYRKASNFSKKFKELTGMQPSQLK